MRSPGAYFTYPIPTGGAIEPRGVLQVPIPWGARLRVRVRAKVEVRFTAGLGVGPGVGGWLTGRFALLYSV